MPKIVDHDRYRRELLAKSFHLFAQTGYAAITMRQLAAGIGVSTGTLYHYFPSKQAIFEQMMLERVEGSMRQFDADLAGLEQLSEKVMAVFQYFGNQEADAIKEVVLYVEFYQHQQRQGQSDNLLRQIYDRIKPAAQELLGSHDAQLIQFLVSIIDGLLLAHVYGQTVDWQAQGAIVGRLLEQYIQSD